MAAAARLAAQAAPQPAAPPVLRPAALEVRPSLPPPVHREVLVDRLSLLRMPTLVVWGARDRVFPESQAREAVARLPEGSLAIISECGHMPHVECPDRFLAALDGFLDGRGKR